MYEIVLSAEMYVMYMMIMVMMLVSKNTTTHLATYLKIGEESPINIDIY